MFIKSFFKIFPPPKYLNIPYAGLDITDDGIHFIEYSNNRHGYILRKFGKRDLKPGIINSGNIVDEEALSGEISSLVKEFGITTVKASLPEEKMYLFKTEVPNVNEDQIRQNIEFKLEENVPLSASDSIFFFDKLPDVLSKGKTYASVSVAPRELVNSYLKVMQKSGLTVVSFEIQAKALARAVVPNDSVNTQMIVHIMNRKTGLYIVSSGVVCFTSTIPWGGEMIRGKNLTDVSTQISDLRQEIEKICKYWSQREENQLIESIIISGKDAVAASQISHLSPDSEINLSVANVWQNAFSIDHYIPKISFDDSLEYAVAAGLAL